MAFQNTSTSINRRSLSSPNDDKQACLSIRNAIDVYEGGKGDTQGIVATCRVVIISLYLEYLLGTDP